MASITDFPTELLDQIFRGLPQADLASLCKAQSTLRNAAEPLLYENIHFLWTEKNTPNVVQFLRTILACPDLALHVRHLKLLGSTFHRASPLLTPRIPIDTDSISPLISAIETLCLPYESSWVKELCAGTMDAFIALLFTQVPKLRSLRIEGNFTREALFFSNVVRSALCDQNGTNLPGFHDLHTVIFKSAYCQIRIDRFPNTDNILPLFYLPTLRKLEAFIDTPRSRAIQWPISPPRLSNLTSLKLWVLRETSLEQVLRATPCLKSLEWYWVYRSMSSELPWGRIIDLEMVASALGHVRDTLESLEITAAVEIGYGNIEYDSLETRGHLRSLSTFQLKTLRMPWPFFVGLSIDCGLQFAHVVPKSVEHLALSEGFAMIPDYEWEDFEMMERLIEYIGGLKPSGAQLRSLHLLSDPFSSPWVTSTYTGRLSDACAKHEVEFRVIRDH